jgi:two-component system sensor histidine kinase CpxA
LWTNPFFFDYKPWLAVVLAVVFISAVCWLPLIRGLTRSISQLTAATGAIAEGRLETRLSIKRRDELGQLSEAINRMAERLSGFVRGQRRFLSDIAHELCSPIARIQVSLGILDQRAEDNQKKYVQGVQEEVEHMSELINELLLFSKAEMNASTTPLTRVNVAETVVHVLQREALKEAQIESHIDGKLEVMARPDYLFRSLANVLRNAIRYAGDAGPIVVSANSGGDLVSIRVTDSGPGLPPAELEEVFKPFYRPELARQRETGGVGLGLAIVRSCVGACGGVVQCRNRSPKGFEVEIRLPVAKS